MTVRPRPSQPAPDYELRGAPLPLQARRAAAQRLLLADLADLSLRVDEAQHELEVGAAIEDLWFAVAGARRMMSLTALMAEKCRKYEKANRR